MPNRFRPALACLAALTATATATAALAQTAPTLTAKVAAPTTVAPLTVQAAPSPKVIEKQSRSFVQTYAAAANPEIDQISRWHEAVCVKVVGLTPDHAAMIKARIESVAQAVGLPATRPDCHTNTEIVFTNQPQAVMDSIARRHEYLLGYEHRRETNRLKAVTHPIQAWYVTGTRGGAGDIAGILFANLADEAGNPVREIPDWLQLNAGVIDDPDNKPPVGCGANPHFTACLTSELRTVFMVADSKALMDKDLGLVADDMVMLALSQPKSLDGCTVLPSVIDVFGKSPCPGRDPPDGLTPADAAYLTALYSSDLEAKKSGEQSDIAGRMAAILIKANAGAGANAGSTNAPATDANAR